MSAMSTWTTLSARQKLLGAALLLVLGATWWAAQTDAEDSLVQPVAGSSRRAVSTTLTQPTKAAAAQDLTPTVTPTLTDWQPVERTAWAPAADPQFAAWMPPPPPPAPREVKGPPPPPPVPVAPPFPYQIIGSLVENGQAQAFLASSTRNLNARAGEVIDGQWRVDQVSATGIALTWLPGSLKQQIAFKALP